MFIKGAKLGTWVATRWHVLLFGVAFVPSGCSAGPVEERTPDTLRVNAAPDERTPRWRLSEEPLLTIGREGDSLYEFHSPGQVLSLSDARIVVSNAYQEIRYYGANGDFLLRVGRKGYGPGEFRNLSAIIVLPGDSIWAVNYNDGGVFREFIVFDDRGRYSRQFRTELMGPVRLPTGDWIGESVETERPSCTAAPTPVRADVSIVRAQHPSGAAARRLARILAGYGVMAGCVPYNVPLSPQGSWTVDGTHLFTADDTGHVIHVRSIETGRVLRTILTDSPRRRVTRAMIEEALNPPGLRGMRVKRETGRTPRPEMQYPDFLPAIASMRVDKAGNLWVRRYYLASDPEHEWWIYEPNGRLMATLSHPSYFRVSEIGPDYVLGLWRDEDDVQTVRRYALLKTGR